MEIIEKMDVCPHKDFCGGCIHQGTAYETQLQIKEQEVLRLLAEKSISYEEYLGMEPSPKQYRYRNKMEYTFGDLIKDGEMTLGMHRKKSFMSIITVDQCQLVDEDFNRILRETLAFCKEKAYPFYNKKSHRGFLRHFIVRKGENTGELLINLVTSSQGTLDQDAYVERMLNLKLNNTIVGILNTINDNLADFVYCEHLNVLWGQDYYMDRILGLTFKVSAFSFFQTNIAAVERLYQDATGLIDDVSGKRVFDLYCGTGTISQILAPKAKEVIGIELVEEAVASAKENAQRNGLSNCRFVAGDVFDVLKSVPETPDVIILDPPRVGVHHKALQQIAAYGVQQIVYVSCNPKTLAENLYFLQYNGYRVSKVKAYDNFPFTKHTECVCLLEKV